MTKHDFKLHTIETAPEASRNALAEVNKKFGRVPNFFGITAESPAATNAYLSLSKISKAPRSRRPNGKSSSWLQASKTSVIIASLPTAEAPRWRGCPKTRSMRSKPRRR
jgi:hypothetical protein